MHRLALYAAENHIFALIQIGGPINLATKSELCSSDYANMPREV